MRLEITNTSINGKCLMDGVIVAFSTLQGINFKRARTSLHNLWRKCIKAISNFAIKVYNLM